MYTFSSKLKTLSIILMLVGAVGIGIGFMSAPKTIQEVETILAADNHGHEAHHEMKSEGHEAHAAATAHQGDVAAAEHTEHLEHVLHQLQNKPWAALYVACIFFMLIAAGALA